MSEVRLEGTGPNTARGQGETQAIDGEQRFPPAAIRHHRQTPAPIDLERAFPLHLDTTRESMRTEHKISQQALKRFICLLDEGSDSMRSPQRVTALAALVTANTVPNGLRAHDAMTLTTYTSLSTVSMPPLTITIPDERVSTTNIDTARGSHLLLRPTIRRTQEATMSHLLASQPRSRSRTPQHMSAMRTLMGNRLPLRTTKRQVQDSKTTGWAATLPRWRSARPRHTRVSPIQPPTGRQEISP